ncbi:putative 5-formyltetrahydrofolate cyclo-ligase [mine drainage metagenome]|uniref:Putative 5-formyltetrahydrofolate cyclo-ligase n=1 Tax=mine drainage metagenome TaxID=410659 RepID=A0A1J5RKZ6_9ZZZZ
MTPLDQQKALLRREAQARRAAARAALGAAGPALLARAALAALDGLEAEAQVVAGYWPLGDEADPRPLLAALAEAGAALCLPVVAGRGLPLLFRRWAPGQALETGPHGTRHPAAGAQTLAPTLVLVPLLAFDGDGGRLGYGGGFYDRTLAALRAADPAVRALGLAFAAQKVDKLPLDRFDQRLDLIVTETGVA